MSKYRSAPIPQKGLPKGLPYIIGNEFAERFSFYGMKGILVVFMTEYLMNREGELDVMSESIATGWVHLFVFAVYFTPLMGAFIADFFLGKYKTIIALSIVYCFGHFILAIDDTRFGLMIGLCTIAIGAGGIKPCVSAHVGDQFGKTNSNLLPKVFGWFYMAINVGSVLAFLAIEPMLKAYGPSVAFGLPGILMFLATIVFWMGRNKFVHIPPRGREFLRESFSPEGLRAAGKLCIIFVFVAMFWALFDQTASKWVLQAKSMDRTLFGIEFGPSQMQFVNPLMVVAFIPLFQFVVYPMINRVFKLTPLRKVAIGFFITIPAFAVPAMIQGWIDAGATPHVGWQVLAYAIMTSAEIMISITCLEFSYTQAPKAMKSFIMGLYLASVALGNLFTAIVNFAIANPDGTSKLDGPEYYWFFTGLIAVTAVLFLIVVKFYKPRTYIQDEAVAEA